MNLSLYDLNSLRTALRREDVLRVVRDACIRHAEHDVICAKGGELMFQNPPGDCHIRFGYFRGAPIFVVKLAMGFYENPSKGLATNNGLMLVFSSETGKLVAILNDEGWLTSWRTAAAGALAAKAGRLHRSRRWVLSAPGIRPNNKRFGLHTASPPHPSSFGGATSIKPIDSQRNLRATL